MLKTFIRASAVSVLALTAGTAIAQDTSAQSMPEQSMPETTAGSTDPVPTTAPDVASDAATGSETPPATTTAPSPETPPAETAATEGTIAAAVSANADLSTLGGALTAADLTATLSGPGPFTVFAPTNAAFELIPSDTRNALMAPANKASLTTLLQFHVVAGNVTSTQLKQQIEAGNGTAELQTVAGQTLKASLEGDRIVLTGENNSKAYVTLADQSSSNGTVHVVNGILVPRLG